MPAYGTSIDDFADVIERWLPDEPKDWSVDVAIHLALALVALRRSEKQGVDTSKGSRLLIRDNLIQAWRELLWVHRHRVPASVRDSDPDRSITISKNGSIEYESKFSLFDFRRYYGDPLNPPNSGKRNASTRLKKRLHARRTGKSLEPEDPGDCP